MLRLTKDQLRDPALYPIVLDGVLLLTPRPLRHLNRHFEGILRFASPADVERHLFAWVYLSLYLTWRNERARKRRRFALSWGAILLGTVVTSVTWAQDGFGLVPAVQLVATLLPFIEFPRLRREYDRHLARFPRYETNGTSHADVMQLLDRLRVIDPQTTALLSSKGALRP